MNGHLRVLVVWARDVVALPTHVTPWNAVCRLLYVSTVFAWDVHRIPIAQRVKCAMRLWFVRQVSNNAVVQLLGITPP